MKDNKNTLLGAPMVVWPHEKDMEGCLSNRISKLHTQMTDNYLLQGFHMIEFNILLKDETVGTAKFIDSKLTSYSVCADNAATCSAVYEIVKELTNQVKSQGLVSKLELNLGVQKHWLFDYFSLEGKDTNVQETSKPTLA